MGSRSREKTDRDMGGCTSTDGRTDADKEEERDAGNNEVK